MPIKRRGAAFPSGEIRYEVLAAPTATTSITSKSPFRPNCQRERRGEGGGPGMEGAD